MKLKNCPIIHEVSGAHGQDMNREVYGRSYLVHGHLTMEKYSSQKLGFPQKYFMK